MIICSTDQTSVWVFVVLFLVCQAGQSNTDHCIDLHESHARQKAYGIFHSSNMVTTGPPELDDKAVSPARKWRKEIKKGVDNINWKQLYLWYQGVYISQIHKCSLLHIFIDINNNKTCQSIWQHWALTMSNHSPTKLINTCTCTHRHTHTHTHSHTHTHTTHTHTHVRSCALFSFKLEHAYQYHTREKSMGFHLYLMFYNKI